ncbi:MAG: hypothetical protein JWR08_1038 [Enterovirga sp.]|jgi:hypothetical protein|nr:hypothetical protein [Enterovirga sp.]
MRFVGCVRSLAWLGMMALPLGLAGCGSTGTADEGGSSLKNILLYGGTTVPPVAPAEAIEVAECPPVTVIEGGAAIRAGEGAAVRSQIAISDVARECTGRPDGTVVLKVGIQLRALLGPGGGAGRFDAPLTIAVKRGDQVVATRVRRVAVAVPAGQFEQTAIVVEDNIAVPPGTGEFDIEIGLGSGARAAAPRGRRRGAG